MTTKQETTQIEQHAKQIRNVRIEMERELAELDRKDAAELTDNQSYETRAQNRK